MQTTTRSPGAARLAPRARPWVIPVVSVLVLLAAIPVVLAQMIPPAAVSASAPDTVFSASRALAHLRVIARAPHPTGSPESATVRDYLAAQLAQLTLTPQVQTGVSVYHDTGKFGVAGARGVETTPETWSLASATVHNVMARIPGTASTGAVVLMAHYDSVPYGPGASDDGAGVAAILEVARALLSGSPLRNDVILLLTDGEEIGLLGSQLFTRHPWMADAAVVLNLEARGSGGAVLMFETSASNAWLVEQYARAAQAPVTSSLATDVWRRLPNSSDLTVFLAAGKQGLNFAYVENWTAYHTTQDSVEKLDARSLQHHGANALALARHFGALDLRQRAEDDSIFFSVLGRGVIRYPQAWAWPLLATAGAATLVVLGDGLRRRRLSLRGLAGGGLAFLTAAGGAALISFLAVRALDAAKGGELSTGMGGTYSVQLYELGLLMFTLAVTGCVYASFQRRFEALDLGAGALLIWLLLAVVTTGLLPGGSYLFFWPLVTGLLTLAAFLVKPQMAGSVSVVLLLIPGIVGLIVAGGTVYLVPRLFGVEILPVSAVLVVLLLTLSFPYLRFAALPRPRAWAGGAALAGVALLVGTSLSTPISAAQPRQNFLFFSQDEDAGTAAWVAQTELPDETLLPWLGGEPKEAVLADYFPAAWDDSVFVQSSSPFGQPAPVLRVLEDVTAGDVRTLRLALSSPRDAWAILAEITAADAIRAVEIFDERYSSDPPRDSVFLKFISIPADGVEATLEVRAGAAVQIRMGDVSLGLPPVTSQPDELAWLLRTGYGGGHGIDAMTLIHRRYDLK